LFSDLFGKAIAVFHWNMVILFYSFKFKKEERFKTDDQLQHFSGNIICRSWISESTNPATENYICLQDDDVKTKAKKIPEKAIKEFFDCSP
jgi:hypothetical protein